MSDEFKINESELKKSETEIVKEKLKKAKALEMNLLTSLVLRKRDLDIDNIFQIYKGDVRICCLTHTLPCGNPHCTTCNVPLLNGDEAEKIMDCIGERYENRILKKFIQTVDDGLNDVIDRFIESLRNEGKEE